MQALLQAGVWDVEAAQELILMVHPARLHVSATYEDVAQKIVLMKSLASCWLPVEVAKWLMLMAQSVTVYTTASRLYLWGIRSALAAHCQSSTKAHLADSRP